MNEYIDVRGPWPVFFSGMVAIVLEGCHQRDINVIEAKLWMAVFIKEKQCPPQLN